MYGTACVAFSGDFRGSERSPRRAEGGGVLGQGVAGRLRSRDVHANASGSVVRLRLQLILQLCGPHCIFSLIVVLFLARSRQHPY